MGLEGGLSKSQSGRGRKKSGKPERGVRRCFPGRKEQGHLRNREVTKTCPRAEHEQCVKKVRLQS